MTMNYFATVIFPKDMTCLSCQRISLNYNKIIHVDIEKTYICVTSIINNVSLSIILLNKRIDK